jgi:hypothetical protein
MQVVRDFKGAAQAASPVAAGFTLRASLRRATGRLAKYICLALFLAGRASAPQPKPVQSAATVVCDSYIIFDMCVRDLVGDGTVDMIYFSDTKEIFMYRSGLRDAVAEVMPLHRCAVPLNPGMQATTDRILHRTSMRLSEELVIAKELITNYAAAKPEIDACHERFEELSAAEEEPVEEFFMGDWTDE